MPAKIVINTVGKDIFLNKIGEFLITARIALGTVQGHAGSCLNCLIQRWAGAVPLSFVLVAPPARPPRSARIAFPNLTGARMGRIGSKQKAKAPPADSSNRPLNCPLPHIHQGTVVEATQAVADSAMQDSERVVTPPLEIISNFSGPNYEPQGPSIYEFEVDVYPELKWNGDYRKISVSVEAAGDSVSEAKEVEDMIRRKQKDLSALRVVADRGLAMGDTVVLNVDAFRVNPDGTQGEPLQFATVRRLRMDTSEEQDVIPGFVESLVGQKVSEERTFEARLPCEERAVFPRSSAYHRALPRLALW